MDFDKALEINQLCNDHIKYAQDYEKFRILAGEAKSTLDILLSAKITEFRAKKSNLGYDMAILMLIENNPGTQADYEQMITNTAKYKALEKIIEAVKTKISYHQSLMRYQKNGETYGI